MNSVYPEPQVYLPVKTPKPVNEKGQRWTSIPTDLAEDILTDLDDLRCERIWWRDEPRLNYQKEFKALCDRISALHELILKPTNDKRQQ